MIQKLLADRFGLVVHRETKDVRAYVLLVGKAGHKLRPAKDGEVTGQMINFWGPSTFEKISMPNFAQMLTAYMREPVVDRTGLAGFFDFKLDLTPEPGGPPNTVDTLREAVLRSAPEQLGLKLELQKTAVEIVVVDRAELPKGN